MQAQLERHRSRMTEPKVGRALIPAARLAETEQDEALDRLQARFRGGCDLVKLISRAGGASATEDGILCLHEELFGLRRIEDRLSGRGNGRCGG